MHSRVISLLRAIRTSFPDATIVYRYGGCYGLYRILKEVFPSATPYMSEDGEHILTEIGGRFYEIKGEHVNLHGQPREKVVKLTKKQMDYWEAVADGQRVEHMLRKYNE